jgi:branched-chain amino acid transport system substrate-binding protein
MKRILFGPVDRDGHGRGSRAVAVAQEPYKIGAVLSVTGPASCIGDDLSATRFNYFGIRSTRRAASAARRWRSFTYDDASDHQVGQRVAAPHEEDKVVAVIGGGISGNSLACSVFREGGRAALVPATSAKISNPVKKWVFSSVAPISDDQAHPEFPQGQGSGIVLAGRPPTASDEELRWRRNRIQVAAWERFGPATDMTAGSRASRPRVRVPCWCGTPRRPAPSWPRLQRLGLDAPDPVDRVRQRRQLQLADAADGIFLSGYRFPSSISCDQRSARSCSSSFAKPTPALQA